MTKKVNIHWFRNDLRLDDNPSLTKATENSELIPIYIFDENNTVDFNHGDASLTWLYESLKLLNKSLENGLVIFKGDPLKILKELIKNNNVSGVYWNRNYAPWEIKRDTIIKQELKTSMAFCGVTDVKKINRNPISSPENHTCCEAKGAISLLEKVSIEKFGDSTIPVSPKVKVRIIEDVHVPP